MGKIKNTEIVDQIRSLWATYSDCTMNMLAMKFDCSETTIYRIIHGEGVYAKIGTIPPLERNK